MFDIMADNSNGNAVVTLTNDQEITFDGWSTAELEALPDGWLII